MMIIFGIEKKYTLEREQLRIALLFRATRKVPFVL